MKSLIFAAAAILTVAASAQVDFNTHRGQNSRTGVNTSVLGPGPGQPALRWYFPLQSTVGRQVILDNTTAGQFGTTGAWTTPAPVDESPDFYVANAFQLANPYQYSDAVASTAGTNDPTAGATATATWVLDAATGIVSGQYYVLNVWFPSSGTYAGGVLHPNVDYAVYKIQFDDSAGTYKQFVDVVPHIGGGGWVRLGYNLGTTSRIFRSGTSNKITITLYNTVPRDVSDNLMGAVTNHIVCADAVQAVPNPGSFYASPIVRNVGPTITDNVLFAPRLESIADPTDSTGTRELNSSKLYAINAAGVTTGQERWNWSPNFLTNVSTVIDDLNPAFNADAAWTTSNAAAGSFGSDYYISPVQAALPGTGRAVWAPNLPVDGFYDVYAWFPRSGNGELHARAARYVVDENGVQTDVYMNQDTQGGAWVRVGTRAYNNTSIMGGLKVEVWNYSNNPGDPGRVVCADAIAFVRSYSAAMYSTPASATINLRLSNGTVAPTDCVFVASEDGRIYCLDARGNGAGGTTVYWAYPSVPDTSDPNWTDPNDPIDGPQGNRIPWPGSFGVSSPLVQNVGGRDILFIGAANGRVYAIDCMGRGDYDATLGKPGTAQREWTWPKAKFDSGTNLLTVDAARQAFVSSVAYDAASNQIFAAGLEGRLFALDAAGNNDQTTDNNWAYPDLNTLPIGAISSTPAIGGGKVIFNSYDGHVYARDVNGNLAPANNWQYPAVAATALQPFQFTSPCYVTVAQLNATSPTDLVYVINEDGNIYALQGTDGALSWSANEVQGGTQSSPVFTRVSPPGTGLIDIPTIVFGTNQGEFLGMYASPGAGPGRVNSAGGKLAWGYQSAGSTIFASCASSYNTDGVRGYVFGAGVDGYIYGFAEGGLITTDPGYPQPPGQVIDTPDDQSSTDFTNLKIKLISKANYDTLRATPATGNPATIPDQYGGTPVVEFGERLNVLAYDFILDDPANPPIIRFRLTGPGGLTLQYDRPAQQDPVDPSKGYATIAIPINYTGPNFITPGDLLTVDVQVVSNGRIINPPVPARNLTVANPLAVSTDGTVPVATGAKSVGWSSDPNYTFGGLSENHINGSNDKAIMSSVGDVSHGRTANTAFWVSDRSRVIDLTATGISGIRMVRGDGEWAGGSAAVVKPLPYTPAWEQMPFSVPNLSLDYPNIDRSQLGLVADPFGTATNPLTSPVRLKPPLNYDPNTPLTRVLDEVRFGFELDVPRFQPANLTRFTDVSGAQLQGGYRSKAIVYVDSNNNGKPDGQAETLTDLPPGARREPYRSLNIGGSVGVDEKMHVVEPTVDLGSLPHSLGYTPGAPWTNNGFVPDISVGAPFRQFFKPFTVVNESNVNMLDLRIATRVGQRGNYTNVGFLSDANDTLAWLDGFPNIITNINPPYAPNNGALDASGRPRVTLHKARPGDRAGTTLTVPDVPYGNTPLTNSLPLVGVAIPLGFPVGDYSQTINVVEDSYIVNGRNDTAIYLDSNNNPFEAFTDPTMRVKFLVRESRLTGGRTNGSITHIDDPLGVATNFTYTNSQPTAFRDPFGALHIGWSANRLGPPNLAAGAQPRDVWSLFFSDLGGTLRNNVPAAAGSSPLRDLMAWNAAAANRFWMQPNGPAPTEPAATLFGGSSGNVVGTPMFTTPSFPVNARTVPNGNNPFETVFWNGRALKDETGDNIADYADNRIFYAQYSYNGAIAGSQWIANDVQLEKKRIRPLNMPNPENMAVFWYADVNGVGKMFQNVRTNYSSNPGDQSLNWSKNLPIDPGEGFSSAKDPQPILRNGDIELAFTGHLKDRTQPEVFYAQFNADGRGQLRDLKTLPDRNREVLVRDGTTGTYRARGVNWDVRRFIEVWIKRPNQNAIRVDIPTSRSTDERTQLLSYDTALGGKMYLDPHVGTVRFTSAPSSDVQVELRYSPRVLRISELGNTGGHSNPSSFFDGRPMWDRRYTYRNGGAVIQSNDLPTVDRMWHIYERNASGPGQSRRPYMKTQRLLVKLDHPVALNNGNVVSLNVGGMVGAFYQVDPGNARVYFTQADEGRTVTITYDWRPANGGPVQSDVVQGTIMWQTELAEKPVQIEQAVDEGTVFAFADPVTWQLNDQRPGLIWVFYTSSRSGTREVFYQSISPRISPISFP